MLDGDFIFGDSEEYFQKEYPSAVNVDNPLTGETLYIPPKTFCFLAGTIFDNPALIKANPRYLSELQNLPEHQKLRELWGNWHARAVGAFYFDRNWIHNANRVPEGSIGVRGYDLAAKAVSETNKSPDATTSINYWKCPHGNYFITGNYHPDFKDTFAGNEIGGRLRVQVGKRTTIMMDQAKLDGKDIIQIIPVDPGAAGIQAYQELAKQFAAIGARCKRDPIATNKSKLTKFLPFADAAENGLVYIVRNTFPNDETIDFIFKELEAFSEERSTAHRKDDFPDCIASAHNAVCTMVSYKAVALPSMNSPTKLSSHRNRIR